MSTLYDSIGQNYSATRREDPFIKSSIHSALGEAQIIINVGAGAGSYEPNDRTVLSVEPSGAMVSQRKNTKLPPIKATAERLPLHDKTVDAAMTVLSLHHWEPNQRAGVQEMCRVARDRVVIVTIDPLQGCGQWLIICRKLRNLIIEFFRCQNLFVNG